MPVSRQTAEALAAKVRDQFAAGETRMLELLAKRLAKGGTSPQWAEDKLAQLRAYRADADRIVRELYEGVDQAVLETMREAYERGGLAALRDIGMQGSVETLAGARAVEAIAAETSGALRETAFRILRQTEDAYRSAVEMGVSQVRLGTATRLQGAQMVLDDLAKKGISGYIDGAGRNWSLETYAEMATRTGAMRASVKGHTDQLQEHGIDLVIVSSGGSACPLCADWEGQVLSSSGSTPGYPTVDEATADGLFHPNCRHNLYAYQEGITPLEDYEKTDEQKAEEAQRYQDEQKMRQIERNIRQSKRMDAAAMTPEAKAKADARLKAYQAKAREHVKQTDVLRQSPREQIDQAR